MSGEQEPGLVDEVVIATFGPKQLTALEQESRVQDFCLVWKSSKIKDVQYRYSGKLQIFFKDMGCSGLLMIPFMHFILYGRK